MSITIGYDLRFARLPHGGKTTCQILPYLVGNNRNCKWVIYYNKDCAFQQAIIKDVISTDIDCITLRAVRSDVLSLSQHLEFLFIKDKIDVYHYLHFDMPISVTTIPSVMMIHDLYPLVLEEYCSKLKQIYFKTVTAYNIRRAAKVITISQSTKNDIVKHFGVNGKNIEVVPPGAGPQFHPINDQAILDTVTKAYDLPPAFLLYCGMHKKHKNLHRLIMAFSQLPKSMQKMFPLVITGKHCSDTDDLQQHIKQQNLTPYIHFIGYAPEDHLPALNNLAALSILPSLYEGYGISPAEAMSCGTPVIGSNISAIPEVISTAGRLFNPYNVDDIASTLKDAIENDVNNQTIQEKCLEHAKQFDWKIKAERTYNHLLSVALSQ